MSNERDRISEAKGVSRGEFEALKRFGDYQELTDRTLMRMEGNKEFRIYCEDSGWFRGRNGGRGVIVTSGFCRALGAAHDRVMEKLKKDLAISTVFVKSSKINGAAGAAWGATTCLDYGFFLSPTQR